MVRRCDPDSISCSSKKYVLQSYYEGYEDRTDSNFQDFMAQQLPIGFCKVLPHNLSLALRLSVFHHDLIRSCSHRHLTSSIKLIVEQESVLAIPSHHCEVIVIERLPSGVFADPFELQHLLQHGVYSNIAVFGDTNLELPSFLSNRSAVEAHMDVGHDLLLGQSQESNINIELPLHARYPPLNESGYWEVKFGSPDLFMRCSFGGNSHNESYLHKIPESFSFDSTSGTVWNIPSGRKAHAQSVSAITFMATLVSANLDYCNIHILFRQLQQTFKRILVHYQFGCAAYLFLFRFPYLKILFDFCACHFASVLVQSVDKSWISCATMPIYHM